MSGYEWQGSGLHGGFMRSGNRRVDIRPNLPLYESVAAKPFWCDNCGGMHPLREHRTCRRDYPFRSAARGAK